MFRRIISLCIDMAQLKFMCPKCKHEFWADEYRTVVCPNCGHIVKKVY